MKIQAMAAAVAMMVVGGARAETLGKPGWINDWSPGWYVYVLAAGSERTLAKPNTASAAALFAGITDAELVKSDDGGLHELGAWRLESAQVAGNEEFSLLPRSKVYSHLIEVRGVGVGGTIIRCFRSAETPEHQIVAFAVQGIPLEDLRRLLASAGEVAPGEVAAVEAPAAPGVTLLGMD